MTEAWRDMPLAEPGAGAAPDVEGWAAMPVVRPLSDLNEVDRETGAPYKLRLAVGQAEAPQDKLAVVRQAYPDAQWVEFGEAGGERLSRQTGAPYERQSTVERHIVFTHPETGRRTTVNPRGADLGDVVEGAPEMARMGAYGTGAGLGAAATGGNPLATAGGGTAASQTVKYAAKPVIEWATGYTIPDTRPLKDKVIAGVVDVGFEFGGGFGAEATLMAARGGSNAYRGWRTARKYQAEGMGRPQVIQHLKDMAREQGKAPAEGTAGALPLATKSTGFRGPYQAAAKYPGKASDTVHEALDGTIEVIRRDAELAHLEAGGVKSLTTGGTLAQEGIEKAGKNAVARQRVIENGVERLIGEDTPIDASPVYELIGERVRKASRTTQAGELELRKSSGGVLPKEYRDLWADLKAEDGVLPFGYLRAMRDKIGDTIGVSRVVQDDSPSVEQLRQLYGALTQTLGNAAAQKGGRAAAEWAKGQAHWAAWKAQQESVRVIANQPIVEQAFKSMFSGLKDGGSLFRHVLETVPGEYRPGLRSLALWKMGATSSTRSAAGEGSEVFDFATFARNWRAAKSSGGVEVVLPPGAEHAALRARYERLAQVSLAAEEGLVGPRAMLNPSGTAQAALAMEDLSAGGLAAQLAGGPKAALSLAGRNALTRYFRNVSAQRQAALMTDPDFVDWAAGIIAMPPPKPGGRMGKAFGFTSKQVTRLGGVAAGKRPDVQQGVLELLQGMRDDGAEGDSEQEGGTGR